MALYFVLWRAFLIFLIKDCSLVADEFVKKDRFDLDFLFFTPLKELVGSFESIMC